MKRDTKPPLNFRFHGELDGKQLIDICIEVQRPKAEKAIADELALAEKAAECPKICINEQNECPKICIGGLETDFMPKYKVSILGDSINAYKIITAEKEIANQKEYLPYSKDWLKMGELN